MTNSSNELGTGWVDNYLGGSLAEETQLLKDELEKVMLIQQSVAQQQNNKIRRAFHNKGTTFVSEFVVNPDLLEHLQTPFLTPGKSYQSFGRFSRSQSLFGGDNHFDQRGFAFRAITDHGGQDFLMSNTPVSFAGDPITFMRGGLILATSKRVMIPFRMIAEFGLMKGIKILKLITGAPHQQLSFTSQQYWSRTPFKINETAVRYTSKPRSIDNDFLKASKSDPDGLTTLLQQQLSQQDVVYDLYAQQYVNDQLTPMDKIDVDWSESDSPLILLGTLTIPEQMLGDESENPLLESVENEKAFSPWVSEDIIPLGTMNRARRVAYEVSATNRGGKPEFLSEAK